MIEIIGIIASIFIVVSLAFNTTTIKGTITLRILNLIGSLFFIIYGICLPSISTCIANVATIILNIIFMIKTLKSNGESNNG